jgi:hypothetical protein
MGYLSPLSLSRRRWHQPREVLFNPPHHSVHNQCCTSAAAPKSRHSLLPSYHAIDMLTRDLVRR